MNGSRVCVAGITDDGKSIRPTLPYPGIHEDWLYANGQCIIRPFARVTVYLLDYIPKPPHTEDYVINPDFKRFDKMLNNKEQEVLLHRITFPTVDSIFGAEIHTKPGYFINENEGIRSLGTIRVQRISFVKFTADNGKCDYRITFVDGQNQKYKLAITDLTFRYFIDHMRHKEKLSCNKIGEELQGILDKRETYLRIGLTRPIWEAHPHCCFLQITGIYTFPDYLDRRCFADFSPEIDQEDEILI